MMDSEEFILNHLTQTLEKHKKLNRFSIFFGVINTIFYLLMIAIFFVSSWSFGAIYLVISIFVSILPIIIGRVWELDSSTSQRECWVVMGLHLLIYLLIVCACLKWSIMNGQIWAILIVIGWALTFIIYIVIQVKKVRLFMF